MPLVIREENGNFFTFVGFHLFYIVEILQIGFASPVSCRRVVHSEWWRLRSPRFVFNAGTENTFALFRVYSEFFIRRHTMVHGILGVLRIIFSAGDGSQFDKMLTRDAPNVCSVLNPRSEGCAQETYIRAY